MMNLVPVSKSEEAPGNDDNKEIIKSMYLYYSDYACYINLKIINQHFLKDTRKNCLGQAHFKE